MEYAALPFDTALYDELPVSVLIYEPVRDETGDFEDYRIVYCNMAFARNWENIYHNQNYIGVLLIQSHCMDEHALRMMKEFQTGTPHSFSTYVAQSGLRLHFEPMTNLPKPYAGFFLTNITDDESREARVHFLRNIQQMNGVAVLLRALTGIRVEAVYISDSFAEMMECTTEEAVKMMNGTGYLRSTHPEDRPLVRSMLKRRVSDEGKPDLTIQKVTAKGHRIWCNVHYAFIDDFNEHYVYCTYSNITLLKEYEERLRSVYVSLGNSFYQINQKTLAIIRANLTRNTIEETRGKDLYPSDSTVYPYSQSLKMRAENFPLIPERTRFLDTFDRKRLSDGYLAGRVSASMVLYSRRPDGHMCFVEYTAILTRHPLSSDMIAFITEKECNDDKVRQLLMDKILVQQFDMVAYLVNEHYGVTIGNAARITKGSIFPVTRNGDYQHYLDAQVIPVLSGSDEEKQAMRKALSLETVRREVRNREPYVVNIACEIENEIYYKRFDFYAVDPDADFYVVLKSDTTEIQREQRMRNDQLRVALEEAKQASVAKTAFLSSMSHEIRTPMNAIIGLDNIALKSSDLPDHAREQLEKIGVSARHLLSLINDILDMSRIESGRMVLKNEEFSFRGFLEQINTLVSSQCQSRGLEYQCQINTPVDEYYIGDDMKLKQVLINILGNAVKFTPPPGRVSFTVERVARFEDQSTLRFIMQDTGIGMDADYLPKIFDAFSQEDATSTNQFGGSGLGMAISKNIVEMMNGNISVQSKKGVGSTFTVNVTLRNTDKTDQPGEREINPRDIKVLIVDDDPVALEHAKIILEETGIPSDTCESGQEAMDLIRIHHARRDDYQLILMDLKMPGQDGLETTRRLRQIYGDDSAIIILTSYNWADIEQEAIESGVDAFMPKPLFASGILYEFQQALRRKQARKDASESPEETSLEGRRILLAEDMDINAEIMMELLDIQDMTAERAENGEKAVELFASKPAGYFDAILMDVRMPVMDGLHAAAAIRAMENRPDASRIPIIAMTANAFDEDVQRSLQSGMNAHLTKPVEPDRLYETLSSLIKESQKSSPPPQNSAKLDEIKRNMQQYDKYFT